MTEIEAKNVSNYSKSTPWHLWCVAGIFILLYSAGIYDYVMTLLLDEAYFNAQNYGNAQIAYFTEYPLLPRIFWTIGIASGLTAPILLLLRTHLAGWLALSSAIAQACLALITFGFMSRWDMFGLQQSLFDILIIVMTFGLFLYCRKMLANGVLE